MSLILVSVVLVALAFALLLAQPRKLTLRARQSFRALLVDVRGSIPFEQISRDAQIALTEFNEAFMLALTQDDEEPWAEELGYPSVSDAPRVRFPIPISETGYKEFTGNIEYKALSEKSLELIPIVWENAISELADVIEAPDFIGWGNKPNDMAKEAVGLSNDLIAKAIIANGPTWEKNDGSINFFQSSSTSTPSFSVGDHPYNIFDAARGGFDNDYTGATLPSTQNLQVSRTRFRRLLAPNGRILGVRLFAILAPPAQEEIWRNILEQDLIIQALPLNATQGDGSESTSFGAVSNRHKGSVQLRIIDQLGGSYTSPITGATGSDVLWYPLGAKQGMYPWVTHRQTTPEVIIRDKNSDYYKTTRRISMAHILKAQGGLAMPQLLQRWGGTSS
jgi:hypothetical protein